MNEKNEFINSLLAVAKEWQKIALIKECRRDFERGLSDETPMEIGTNNDLVTIKTEIKEEPDLQLEVYEDKEYDIEEVKYWNFVAKKRAPKPDIIRTLVYKVPEIAKPLLNQQQQQQQKPNNQIISSQQNIVSPVVSLENKIKSNSDIQIISTAAATTTSTSTSTTPQLTRVLSSTNNISNKNRLNTLNLTALDMAHYNSNKISINYDYDQFDILKSNPIGTYSQHYNNIKSENKYNDKRPNRRLPDEIQPLKSLQQELNSNEQQKLNKNNNKKKGGYYNNNNNNNDKLDKPKVVIEIDEPAPAGAKIVTRSRTISRTRNNNGNKRSSDAYDLRQLKRKVVNYNENEFTKNKEIDIYNFCDSNNDIDDLEGHLRGNSQDIDDFMEFNEDKVDEIVNDEVVEEEDDEVDLINEKIDKNDKDFDVRLERRKLKAKNKALKSTTNKPFASTNSITSTNDNNNNNNNNEKPKRRERSKTQKNVNIYSKVYKTSSTSKFEELVPNNAELNLPDDMRVTRRLSLRRASLNRASTNSSEIFIKKEEQLQIEESDSNSYKGSKSKASNNRRSLQPSKINRKFSKDSNSSSDLCGPNRRTNLRLSRSDTQNTDTDETLSINSLIIPKKKYRSYLAALTDEERAILKAKEDERNKEILENFQIKNDIYFIDCHVKLQRTRMNTTYDLNKKNDEVKDNKISLNKDKMEFEKNNENNTLKESEPKQSIESEIKDTETLKQETKSSSEVSKSPEEGQKEIVNTSSLSKDAEKPDLKSETTTENVVNEKTEVKAVENTKTTEEIKIKNDDNLNQTLNETLNSSTASTETRRSARLTRSKAKLLDKN